MTSNSSNKLLDKKKRTFEEFIENSISVSSKQEMYLFFSELGEFVVQIQGKGIPRNRIIPNKSVQFRFEEKKAELTRKGLTDWFKANGVIVGQMLTSDMADKQIFGVCLPTIVFMAETKNLKEGLLLSILSNHLHTSYCSEIGDLLLKTSCYMQNDEAEEIFKYLNKTKGSSEIVVPLITHFVVVCSKSGLKFASKERLVGFSQKCVRMCYNKDEGKVWLNNIEEIFQIMSMHAIEDISVDIMNKILKENIDVVLPLQLLTKCLRVRGDGPGIDRDFFSMKLAIDSLEKSDIKSPDDELLRTVLEYINIYIESTHLSIPSQLVLRISVILVDVLDFPETLFKWINETVIKEKKTPSHDTIMTMMTFLEGHISAIMTENGMICLQRVLLHYNQTLIKSIIIVDDKIEV
ncbi:hypothetical protein EIN_470200, partial [Entamoeba invadens IP1]